ncbi:MAG TPA: SIS domain-containing protein [Propionibacteriaceae bacterium]|nr:SIS domain-containing protein [Propionibacteriaceae bacterium]
MTQPAPQERTRGAQMEAELVSQPEVWERAARQARSEPGKLPADGQRIAVVGCGTSWFMAQSYASLREGRGQGITDAFPASEAFVDRGYDTVMVITRSGTTTEVLETLQSLEGKVHTSAIIGDTASPAAASADTVVALPYADEQSVVQTRFATATLIHLRAGLGLDDRAAVEDAQAALAEEVPPMLVTAEQFSFLGRGWTVGLAHEAALKMREASQSWTESYPAMEYRHGPISIAAPNRVTWLLGDQPKGLGHEVAATGAMYIHRDVHPLAELVRAQRVALERARARALDPDQPRNLTRSVILGP